MTEPQGRVEPNEGLLATAGFFFLFFCIPAKHKVNVDNGWELGKRWKRKSFVTAGKIWLVIKIERNVPSQEKMVQPGNRA